MWFNAEEGIFGSVATSFMAFRQAKDRVRTPPGLEKVIRIPELEQLVAEMEKARAGANKQIEQEARAAEAQDSAVGR